VSVAYDFIVYTLVSSFVVVPEKLKSRAPARIVVVSSIMHKFAKLDPTDMNYTKRPWPGAGKAYHDRYVQVALTFTYAFIQTVLITANWPTF